MCNLGFGIMIRMLGGNEESIAALKRSVGEEIVNLKLTKNRVDKLVFMFADGSIMNLFDGGQSCCEHRYMHTDDELVSFVGATFLGVEIRDAPSVQCEYDVHEVQFLHIITDRGIIVVETHNEHNGYYGGFWIMAEIV